MSDYSLILQQLEREQQRVDERRKELEGLVVDISSAERERIREKSAKDFWFFAKKVFPEYFKYKFSRMHKDIIKFAKEKNRKVDVVAGPPEHGKTTLLRVFRVWASIYGYYHYIIKVCETSELSTLDLAIIKMEFEDNPRINFLYGDLKTKGNWEENQFAIQPTEYNDYGTFFEAFAYGIPPTGRVWKHFRPDFCDIDDLENYKKSSNPKISEDKLQFINNDIVPRISEKGHIIWFGNNARKTMAMNMIIEMKKEDRDYEYPAFRVHVYPAFKNGKPLWTARYSYKTEEGMRIGLGIGSFTWQGNYQQKPTTPEGGIFKKKHYQTYGKLPKDATGIIWCDPAAGKKNCYKVALPIFFSRETRKFYLPDVYCKQSDWEPYFLAMYELHERYMDRVMYIAWEQNFFQDQYLRFKEIYESTKDRPDLPIRPVEVKSNKQVDIEMFSVPYEYGKIYFSKTFDESGDGQEAKNQMFSYPDYTFNDFPDAAARGYKELFKIFAGYMGSLVRDGDRQTYKSVTKIRTQRL